MKRNTLYAFQPDQIEKGENIQLELFSKDKIIVL